ncbi:MAG: heme lyase CcmF/NrfE family subunit [Burkholderiaceae bacterium]|jgi:cytochrome c-type biogenesis protein CcmF
MIPELGHFSLIVALSLALILGTVPLVGASLGSGALMGLSRPVARAHFVLVFLAFFCLAYSFYMNDFTVVNVAQNSNSNLPDRYRIAATWGSHEGSLLLWVLMLSVWMLAVSFFSRNLPQEVLSRVLSVMGLVSVGFLIFLLFTSDPFERVFPGPSQGSDLNPLLQDPGMVVHPPMLYMGYVGFSVAFAFAIAALLGGRLDATWARWSRPWTVAAWCFLTVGICLGSAWAYYVLGWGGWWFWDPVENASFMPWLVGTALIHSLAVTEKRGAFKSWTVLLAIIAFSLSLLGTFLVRSGVLTSVHAFATDPTRGVFILIFLAIVIGGSLALYAWRAPSVGLGTRFGLVSRESMLLANNVAFAIAMAAVALGTLYPLALDGLGIEKLSVGAPYFNAVFYPLMIPALILIGLGPITRWRESSPSELWQRRRWPLLIAVVAALALPVLFHAFSAALVFALFLAFWIIVSSLDHIRVRLNLTPRPGLWQKIKANSPSFYGMHLAHIGVAVFIIGVAVLKSTETETDTRLDMGSTISVAGYEFTLRGVSEHPGPNYRALQAQVEVSRDGRPYTLLLPEKRTYLASGQTMTEAAINNGIFRHLYVSLGEPIGSNAWGVRIYIKPFVSWIWAGCFFMAFGGLLALSDRRYRLRAKASQSVSSAPGVAPGPKVTDGGVGATVAP